MGFDIADRWFEQRRIDDDIHLIWEPHADPFVRCNMWHVRGSRRDLLIDTGLGIGAIRPYIEDTFGHAVDALITHSHYDHSGGLHEFDHRIMHDAEAEEMRSELAFSGLTRTQLPDAVQQAIETDGYTLSDILIDALPYAGYDLHRFSVAPADATRLVSEGDEIDLGNRRFQVLHLPGHSAGSIGLWEASTGVLFSGDAVYDGPLLDKLPGSDPTAYATTMERLLTLPVSVVHAGHDPSFGRDRLREICRNYLDNCK